MSAVRCIDGSRRREQTRNHLMFRIREAPRDSLLEAAKQLAREHENVSTSFLQRRLQIGYPRAARLKEQLDEELAREAEEGDEAIDELEE